MSSPEVSVAGHSAGAWGPATGPAGPDDLAADRYEQRGLLGQGGMGRVWAVWDRQLHREIALKEVVPALDSPSMQARIEREARLTAQIDHPGVVPVYDAGRTPSGGLYYTMRLVRGQPLSEVLADGAAPDARNRLLRLGLQACDAVAAAHARGIVHRDLKPTNLLVGADGALQVADWGLAAQVQELTRDPSPVTPVGTPGWMSPEQAAGGPGSPAGDVYSLGCILRACATAGTTAPPPPDLTAIVDRATAADPGARYPDAAALSADLAAWLDGGRVAAYDYTVGELLRRWAWRRRVRLAVAGLTTAAVLAIAVAAWARTAAERTRAVAAEGEARAALATADAWLAAAVTERAVAAHVDGDRRRAEVLAAWVRSVSDSPLAAGVLLATASAERPALVERHALPCVAILALSPDGELAVCQQDDATAVVRTADGVVQLHGPPAVRAAIAGDHVVLVTPTGHVIRRLGQGQALHRQVEDRLQPVALAPSGAWLVWGSGKRAHRAALPDGAAEVLSVCQAAELRMRMARITDDGAVWVLCSDGTLERHARGAAPRHLGPLEHEGARMANALAVHGDRALVGDVRGNVVAVDLRTGARGPVLRVVTGSTAHLALTGDRALAIDTLGQITVWDPESLQIVASVPTDGEALAAITTSHRLQVAGRTATVWALPARPHPHLLEVGDGVSAVDFGDGGRFAAIDGAGAVSIWDRDGRLVSRTAWQRDVGKALVWTANGTWLTAAMGAPWLQELDRDGRLKDSAPAVDQALRRLVAASDGGALAADWRPAVHLLRPGRPVVTLPLPAMPVDLAAGAEAWALTETGDLLRVADPALPAAHLPGARAIGAARDVVVAADDAGLTVLDAGGATRRVDLPGAATPVKVALSPDASKAAIGALDGLVWLVDLDTDRVLATLSGHRERAVGVAFSDDGRTLLTGSWDGTVRRWWLPVLEQDPATLRATVEAAWGTNVEDLIGPRP